MAGKKASGNPRTRALLSLCIVFVLIVVAGYLALFGFGKGRMIAASIRFLRRRIRMKKTWIPR